MARVVLPESRLARRKRRRRKAVFIFSFAGLLVLSGALVWLSHVEFLRISDVQVSGNQTLASSSVVSFVEERLQGTYGGVFPKNNILLYPQDTIAAELAARYPVLKNVEVAAQDFHTIRVSLVEREPKALWCGVVPASPEPCFFIDDEGLIYAQAPQFSEPVYARYFGVLMGSGLPKRYLSQTQFRGLFALVDALAQKESTLHIAHIAVDAEGDVRVAFEKDFTLIFSLQDEGGDIFERYTLARGSEPFAGRDFSEFEYLDLRFGDKLYYKVR